MKMGVRRLAREAIYRLKRIQSMQRINCGLARVAAVRGTRMLDDADPRTWEFSAFSQNGEDGITDFLIQRLNSANRYFVEIGASDGAENNSSWLAIARQYRGLMIDGNQRKSDYCRFLMGGLSIGVQVSSLFVAKENIVDLHNQITIVDPDFFSIDIDGVDYHIAEALMEQGFRPKIVVVEYNSCFGPVELVTIPYSPDFNYRKAHPTQLYYGASIGAWRHLLERRGYKFLTVESNGVNAFFIRPECFSESLCAGINGVGFEENFLQTMRFAMPWDKQFALIEHMPFVCVDVAGGELKRKNWGYPRQ